MASSLNLREYQESILARLETAQHADFAAYKNFLGVSVGGVDVLVDMAEIVEVLPVPAIHAVPNTQNWFLGTANVRGNLYAINDLMAFLQSIGALTGANVQLKKSEFRILLLQQGIAPYTAVLVERLIGLRSLEKLKKVPSRNKDDCEDALEQKGIAFFSRDEYEDDSGNLWRMLDCRALVQEKAFMQATLL
jgi:twitching motility protein PilI